MLQESEASSADADDGVQPSTSALITLSKGAIEI